MRRKKKSWRLGIAAVKWGEIPIASGLHFAYCMAAMSEGLA